jgi:hypothetical protein
MSALCQSDGRHKEVAREVGRSLVVGITLQNRRQKRSLLSALATSGPLRLEFLELVRMNERRSYPDTLWCRAGEVEVINFTVGVIEEIKE